MNTLLVIILVSIAGLIFSNYTYKIIKGNSENSTRLLFLDFIFISAILYSSYALYSNTHKIVPEWAILFTVCPLFFYVMFKAMDERSKKIEREGERVQRKEYLKGCYHAKRDL